MPESTPKQPRQQPPTPRALPNQPAIGLGGAASAGWMQATTESRIERIATDCITDRPQIIAIIETERGVLRQSPANAGADPENRPVESHESSGLAGLRRSVAARGIVEPLLLRPRGADRYQVIAGSRRLHVARQLLLATVPAVVRDLDDAAALVAAVWAIVGRQQLSREQRDQLQRRLVDVGVGAAEAAAMVAASQASPFLVNTPQRPQAQLPAVLRDAPVGQHFLGEVAAAAPLLPDAAGRLLTDLLRDADPEQFLRDAR